MVLLMYPPRHLHNVPTWGACNLGRVIVNHEKVLILEGGSTNALPVAVKRENESPRSCEFLSA